tara:strand:- start:2397 stop:3194 length:798 start_codon:yes stop_codon:yes gene_type:complete
MLLRFLKARKRKKLMGIPLPEEWWSIIDRRVPMVRKMNESDRQELGASIQILLHEKRFEGCAGLEITDEIRVTIAAQAAVLLLHRSTRYYPTLRTILVYPHAYRAPGKKVNPDGTVTEGAQTRLGESWFRGSLVLSWDDVVRGAADEDDGHNVVFHEFAHQLDSESGSVEGAPVLPSADRYRAWARVLGHEYEELVRDIHLGHRTLLDPYGGTNPPEFFAVATEFFFEKPKAMKRHAPELYDQLAGFYRFDPLNANAPAKRIGDD